MPQLPVKLTTRDMIVSMETVEKPRDYLGMSMIGHSCDRYLWYYFRWAFNEVISNRIERLFKRGHKAEDVIDDLLKSVGVQVVNQEKEIIGAHGHAKGHCDGVAFGVIEAPKTPHLLEKKTHNEKSFKSLISKGVQQSKPTHFAQMQRYMEALKLTRALYFALNKNDDDIYLERVYFDKDVAQLLIEREAAIIESAIAPRRIGNASWFECKMCSAKEVCHFNAPIEKTCRSCLHCAVRDHGEWHCKNEHRAKVYPTFLSVEMQRKGCNLYKLDEEAFL